MWQGSAAPSGGQGDAGAAAISPAPSRSEELRRKLALTGEVRREKASEPTLPDYIDYLQRMYDIVRASVPLMRLALTKCGEDGMSRRLAAYFEAHIEEEAGHDQLLLRDLEELGVPRERMAERMPNHWLTAAVGAQYYWVEHVSPVALLGYIAFLENEPPSAELIGEVQRILPGGVHAVRTLSIHCEADPYHKRMLDELIDSLELSDRDAALIGTSALFTAYLTAQARAGSPGAR
jgi:pyrroloquinoline quinone (PQQ) biosynthesis protein C